MLKRSYPFIIISTLLLFWIVSIYVGQRGLVGSFGVVISMFSIKYLGLFAYLFPILLFYPLYRVYKNPIISIRRVERILASVLFFIAILLFEAMVFTYPFDSYFGVSIVLFLKPIIGLVGVWLFWFLLLSMSIFIYFDLDFEDITSKAKALLGGAHISTLSIKKEQKLGESKKVENKRVSYENPYTYTDTKTPTQEINFNPQNDYELENIMEEDIATRRYGVDEDEEIEYENMVRLIEPKDAKESPQTPHNNKETRKEGTLVVKELEENTKFLSSIEQGEIEKPKDFKLPSLDFLNTPPSRSVEIDEKEIDEKIEDLLDKLQKFKIDGDVVRTYSGPVVTTFEFRPAPSVKVSRILNLQDDLAMALKAKTIRIQAPVPGKDVVGIEIPNREFETIYLREILESEIFTKAASPLTIALGKDIVGNPFITDLKKLPHLLIAGTTGSGKSVGINAMILSLLYRNSPQKLKFLMIDPKMLEFSIYNDIPHLLTPVITQAKQAVVALNNMVAEMERRYALMSSSRTKNIESYNQKAKKENFDELPYIVVIIDELADLMMTSGKDVEYSIGRLAQMARASGIHLIVATQRPSVDVVTGLIKANLPSRISFRVGQKIDSKVILDQFGAESLLGRGDMLFTPPGVIGVVRLHAPWCSEGEIEKIVEFIKAQKEPEYNNDFLNEGGTKETNYNLEDGELDELFEEAKRIVLEERKTSISYIQRRLQIGYNRSARIVEQLEAAGILSAPDAKGNREIL